MKRGLMLGRMEVRKVFETFINFYFVEMYMKKIFSLSAIAAVSAMSISTAMAADPAPADPGPITANVTLASEYRYRGISQSNFLPALQGGFDYAHSSGFYIGNWNSSISWISDGYNTAAAISAPIEMDFYAGYKTEVAEGITLDGGVLQYYYPISGLTAPAGNPCSTARQACGVNPNTTELYTSVTYGIAMLKYSYALTNLFGIDNSKGSSYVDLTLNYDLGNSVTLNGHVGNQMVSNNISGTNFSYTDYKLGATYDLGSGMNIAGAYISTNAGDAYLIGNTGQNAGKGKFVVSLTKTF